LIALGQTLFVQHQANIREVTSLQQAAKAVSDEIYPGEWDPTGYRQSDLRETSYFIITNGGLLVDFADFVPGLIAQARPLREDIFGSPVLVKTEIGEIWLIAGRKLIGGSVVAGISNPNRLKNPKATLLGSL